MLISCVSSSSYRIYYGLLQLWRVGEQDLLQCVGVSRSVRGVGLSGDCTHFLKLLRRQCHLHSFRILYRILKQVRQRRQCVQEITNLRLLSARDGDNVITLGEIPSDSNLACGSIVTLANRFEAISEFEDVWEVLLAVSLDTQTPVIGVEVVARALIVHM